MSLLIESVVEFNDEGYLIYSSNYIGAYVRGRTKAEALKKFDKEIYQYIRWAKGKKCSKQEQFAIRINQEKKSDLQICDADTDVLFESERAPLGREEYMELKALVIKSARDFKILYQSIPDKQSTSLKTRKTFYGEIPRTANEMYVHTNNMTNYYVGEIGVEVDNLPDILESRINALRCVETVPNYLNNPIYDGSYGEQWSLRKVLRRFIWHDRIHAKAMYRMAVCMWGEIIQDPFFFGW